MIIYNTTIDQVGCSERVNRIFSRSIKKESKIAALKLAKSIFKMKYLTYLYFFIEY